MKREWFSKKSNLGVLGLMLALGSLTTGQAEEFGAQHPQPNFLAGGADPARGPEGRVQVDSYLGYPRFKIPFNVESAGADLAEVQLWVSTDAGKTWQMHGAAKPEDRQFDFRAAAEGVYFFSVQTVDARGNSFPSQNPPLKVFVDTSRPEAAIRANQDSAGRLVVDVRVADENLREDTAILRVRTDRDATWRDIELGEFQQHDGFFDGQVVLNLPPCREVGLVFAISDKANNQGEATFQYTMPRTAAGDKDMTLASTKSDSSSGSTLVESGETDHSAAGTIPSFPNSIVWKTESSPSAARAPKTSVVDLRRPERAALPGSQPGRLAASRGELELDPPLGAELEGYAEELPLPQPENERSERNGFDAHSSRGQLQFEPTAPEMRAAEPSSAEPSSAEPPLAESSLADQSFGDSRVLDELKAVLSDGIGSAFHCKSQAFSLDYSVEAMGGSTLSKVELWGTEDGGLTWEEWGADPDRQSPFDVQVGNDGLFGFRMVIVSTSGLVSNRPKNGDTADVWINVDTALPKVQIKRAVYGEGPEEGLLVIDYDCTDGHLVDRPISLAYSEGIDGPWSKIASGLSNSGTYLWKADPNLPRQIFLRVEAVDKSGNIGMHRLDVPIDTNGLIPRGRIQGIRPILKPAD